MKASVRVIGDKELVRKMTNALYAEPVRRFFAKAGNTIKARAMDKAPRWDGNLVNSLMVEEDTAIPARFVRVGTNSEYAPSVEEGSRPHWAPIAPLAAWAATKGTAKEPFNPYALQAHIAKHGTKPHPFLKPALDDSENDIRRYLSEMGTDIEQQAEVSA